MDIGNSDTISGDVNCRKSVVEMSVVVTTIVGRSVVGMSTVGRPVMSVGVSTGRVGILVAGMSVERMLVVV